MATFGASPQAVLSDIKASFCSKSASIDGLYRAFNTGAQIEAAVYTRQTLAGGERSRLLSNALGSSVGLPRVTSHDGCPGSTTKPAVLVASSAEVQIDVTTMNTLAVGLVQMRLTYDLPPSTKEGESICVSAQTAAAINEPSCAAAKLSEGVLSATTALHLEERSILSKASPGFMTFLLGASSERRALTLTCVSLAFPTYEGHVAALAAAIPPCSGGLSIKVNGICANSCDIQSIYGFTDDLSCQESQVCATAFRVLRDDKVSTVGICVATNPAAAHALNMWSTVKVGRGDSELPVYPSVPTGF
jgi:hypothetical protein